MTRKLAIPLLVLLAFSFVVGAANAVYVKSIPYNAFNKLSPITFYQVDKNYTTSWQVKIVNNLVYNVTTPNANAFALVRLQPSTAGDSPYVELSFIKGGTLLVTYSYDGTSDIQAATGTWYAGKPVVVTLDSNGYLDVNVYDNNDKLVEVLKDFTYGNLTLQYVGAHGGQYTATAGYVQVEVSSGPAGDVAPIINMWIPVIVSFAMLAVVLGFIEKVSK